MKRRRRTRRREPRDERVAKLGGEPSAEPIRRRRPDSRSVVAFLFTFLCVFAGLAWPWASFGATYSRAFSAIGNGVISALPDHAQVDVKIEGSTEHPPPFALETKTWKSTVWITDHSTDRKLTVPVDLRGVHYVPMIVLIALVVATPFRRKLKTLAIGLALLVPTTLLLSSLPLVSELSGCGHISLFDLPPSVHSALALFFRAFIDHPGMAYAIPAILWWVLLTKMPLDPATQPATDPAHRSLAPIS